MTDWRESLYKAHRDEDNFEPTPYQIWLVKESLYNPTEWTRDASLVEESPEEWAGPYIVFIPGDDQ